MVGVVGLGSRKQPWATSNKQATDGRSVQKGAQDLTINKRNTDNCVLCILRKGKQQGQKCVRAKRANRANRAMLSQVYLRKYSAI